MINMQLQIYFFLKTKVCCFRIIELSLQIYKKHKISKGLIHLSEHFELWANY